MIEVISCCRNTVVFSLVFCWQVAALAQDGQFQIDNLTFMCPSCRYVSDSLCQITAGYSSEVMQCSPAGRSLLFAQAFRSYDGKHPSANELMRYLLLPSSESDLDLAFRLLFIAEGGENSLQQNARNLLKLRLKVLQRLLDDGAGNEAIWRDFWNVTSFTATGDELRFKALIAARVSGFSLSDFLTELTAQDLEKESDLCGSFANAVAGVNDAWARQFSATAEILKLCKNEINACGNNIPAFLDPVFVRYLGKVKVLRLLRGFNEGQLGAEQFLNLLSEADYRSYSTPGVLKAVAQALKNCRVQEESAKQMTAYFAAADPEIKAVWQSVNVSRDRPSGFRMVYLLGFGAIILVWILAMIRRCSERRFLTKDYLPKHQEELRELLSDFGLDFTASLEDLNKQYRQQARKTHPDGEQGDSKVFVELQKKFSRAKKLMKQLRRS